MHLGTIRYSIGNEHNPGNPWGRSELVVSADGAARLDHYYSRQPGKGAWAGQVSAGAMEAIRAGLERAGFPAVPDHQPVGGATFRTLVVESGGTSQRAVLDRYQTDSLPAYAEVFDILDGIIRQLSGDDVTYPTRQGAIVSQIRVL